MEFKEIEMDLFLENYKIKKPIRLIELFGGYGSQHFALKYLGVEFEQWKLCEWAVKSIQAYKDAHCKEDTTDYSAGLTKKEVIDYLFNKHISMDYKKPMTYEEIKRLGEKKQRIIYNNIQATKNLVDVQQVKGSDLNIVDVDKHEYLMTYSFPCQNLSLAGKQEGMEKGSNTSSSQLWEVERILNECEELPQILLMENVTQVHGKKNKANFDKWCDFLSSKGYSNFWKDLNAKNFGVPQNRNRTFMVSILGDYIYEFPKEIELKTRLKDILEEEVDEKFYISEKMLNGLIQHNKNHEGRTGFVWKPTDVNESAKCIRANGALCPTDNTIIVREATKKGYAIAEEGDSINISQPNSKTRRGRVGKQVANTLLTGAEQCVLEPKKELDQKYIDNISDKQNFVKNKSQEMLNENGYLPEMFNPYNKAEITNIAPTQTTHCGNTGSSPAVLMKVNDFRIRKLIPKECFRLMGVRDEDFENIAENQSNSSLCHLAGDSIVSNVLMAILKKLF
jgi:DNA (cytosine-5)-methyltransferase 1